jgi:sugar phosphate isomerase/epimerase
MNTQYRLSRRDFLAGAPAFGAAALAAPHLMGRSFAAGQAPYQIGCYTRPWSQYDWRVAADAVAEAGYKHLGLMTTNTPSRLVISATSTLEEAAEVGRQVRQRGMEIPSLWGGGIPVNKSLEAGIEVLRRLIDCAAAAGAKTLLMGGTADEKLYKTYFKAIAECCDYAAEKQVGITLKPHGGLTGTGPLLRKAVELVGKRNFTIWYDAGNVMFYYNGEVDPVQDCAALDGLVSGWCIKDYSPKRPETSPPPAKPSPYTGDVSLTPGTGVVNFKGVMARLRQGGFAGGPLVVETLAPGEPPELLEEAKKARQFLEQLVSG